MIQVLYVDDEPDLLDLGKLFLEQDGVFQVGTTTSPSEALNLLRSQSFQAIISDYQMPEMDGIGFLRAVRASGNDIPFIIFTGRGREEVVIQALNEGADFYLQKGGDPEPQFAELAHKVRIAIQRRHTEASLARSREEHLTILRTAMDGFMILDLHGQILEVNETYCRMTGYSQDELMSMHINDLEAVETASDTTEHIRKVIIQGEDRFETQQRRKDGSTFYVEVNVLYQPAEGGRMIVFMHDITKRKDADMRISESERKYRTLAESSPDEIFIIGNDGTMKYVNTAALAKLGRPFNEVLGKKRSELFPSGVAGSQDALVRKVCETGQLVNKEEKIQFGSREFWIDTSLVPLKDASGTIIEILGVARDVTERKQMYDELNESRTRLEEVIQFLPDATLAIDRDRRVIIWNKAIEDMTGIPAAEMLGKGDYAYSIPFYGEARPALMDLVFEHSKDAAARYPSVRREGDSITSEVFCNALFNNRGAWVFAKASPLYDASGRVVGVIESIRDITDLKNTELALKASESQYRNVVEDQTEFISRFLPDGTHVFVNEAYCRYFGLKREDLIGHRFRPVIPPGDQPGVRQFFASLTIDHPVAEIRHRIIMPDGSTRWQWWSDRAIFNEAGEIIEYQSVGKDITDIVLAEEALETAREKFSKAFKAAPDAITISDLESGEFVEVNDAATRIFGYSRDELIGHTAVELGIWLSKAEREEFISRVRTNGRVEQYEITERKKSGKFFNALVNAETISVGNQKCFLAIIRDVTQERLAKDALVANEERLRIILSRSFEAIVIHQDGRVVMANENAARLLGAVSPEELKGKPLLYFIPPDYREAVTSQLNNIRNFPEETLPPVEQKFLRLDGNPFDIECLAITTTHEERPAVLVAFRDISERKRVEEVLKTSEERYRSVFENTGTATVIVENDGTISLANAEFVRLSGLSKDEIENKKKWMDFVVREDLDRMIAQHTLRRKDREKALRHYEFRFIRKSGEIRNIYLTIDIVPGTERSIASLLDITDLKQAEKALENSEAKYRSIIENIQDVFYRSDRSGRLIMVSPSWATLLGYNSLEDCIGFNIAENFYYEPEKRHDFLAAIEKNGHVDNYEVTLRKKDGGPVTVSTSSHYYYDSNGEVAGIEGIFRDITERKQAENLLLERDAALNVLLNAPEDSIILLSRKGIIININEAGARRLGGTVQEITGRCAYDLLPPEIARSRKAFIDQVFTSGEPKHFDDKRSGMDIHNEIFPVFNADHSSVEYVAVFAQDISERKKTEEALRQSEERFRSIVQNSSDLIILTDPDGNATFVSPQCEQVLGYPAEKIFGEKIPGIIHPEDRARCLETWEKVLHEGMDLHEYEYRIIDATGAVRWVAHSASLLRLDNRILGMQNTIRNITRRKKVEEDLQESEELFRELFHKASDGIFLHEVTPESPGTYIQVNDAAIASLGYSREELLRMSPRDIVPGGLMGRLMPDVIDQLRDTGSARFESAYIRKDGSQIPVEVSTHQFFMKGKVLALSVSRDITVRKQAEAEIQTLNQFHSSIITNANVCLIVLDLSGNILLWNLAAEKISGYSEGEVKGDRAIWKLIYPDKEYRRKITRHIEDIIRQNNYLENLETFIRCKDGTVKTILWNTRSLLDITGTVTGYVAIGVDISKGVNAEKALKESEQRLADIIDFLPDATFAIDLNKKIIAWNRAIEEMTGYKKESMLGIGNYEYSIPLYAQRRPILIDLILEPDETVMSGYHNIIKEGSTLIAETRNARPLGRESYLWIKATPLYDANGAITGAIESIRDITEYKRVENALRLTNQKLNLLSSITRHDINNRISAILGYLGMARKSEKDPVVGEYISKSESATRAILSHITFTRAYQDLGTHNPKWQVIAGLLSGLQVPATLSLNAATGDVEVFADPMLEKVFFNLLDNSIRHGEHVTEIRVSASQSGKSLMILWEDNGIGIPAEEKEKIFDRGYGKNTGFGLFLVREILSLTGITICETGEPGKGARFGITVPEGMFRIRQ